MSKKKAFSGSTMTLKDFHGGSIPSDLPLPSAPGVIVRQPDRSGFDRQIPNAWGNPMGRSDYRSRPGSSGANRHFDEKASLLSHPAHFGRNFDEDERKPLDGVSIPRRTFSDDSLQLPGNSNSIEPKLNVVVGTKFSARPGSSPLSQSPGAAGGSYSARFAGSNPVEVAGNSSQAVPNAWSVKKEAMGAGEQEPPSALSGFGDASLFARASAVEKVSSGRWQSKHSTHIQQDVEIRRAADFVTDYHSKDHSNYIHVDSVSERGEFDVVKGGRHADRGDRVFEDEARSGVEELPYSGRERSIMHPEAKELFNYNGHRLVAADAKLQTPVHSEGLERPKLKLLPRSKPVETQEPPVVDYKQGHQLPVDSSEPSGNANPPKPGLAGAEGVERPKLNLKPRSQPLEQSEEIVEKERKTLFGGARPRELVLKERGVDNVAIDIPSPTQSPNRAKHDLPKNEARQESMVQSARFRERHENVHLDQRTGRGDPERKDHRANFEKTDTQRTTWRNENRRNGRETDKMQQKERLPEPESWRKPIEQPKSPGRDAPGLRHGKAMSALELAQAFSRSVSSSDTKTGDFPGQRGMAGRNQVPFSRLTANQDLYNGPTPRHKINGY